MKLATLALTTALAIGASSAHAFDVEGHRGARGLAPENTLAAFRLALSLRVTTIETDLAVTRDDVVVVSHNPRLNPDITRDASGGFLSIEGPPIRTLTLAELATYVSMTDFSVNVAVGQAFTQAPQDTHSEPRNASSMPGDTTESKPRPAIVSAKVPCTSPHARTQREQTMHFDGS